jgi:hypothetical protein
MLLIPYPWSRAAVCALTMLPFVVSDAQELPGNATVIQIVPGTAVPVPPEAGANIAKASAGTNTASSPEEKRLQELLKLKFDRSPASILEAKARVTAQDGSVESFRINVVSGRWSDVGAFVQKLPKDHALKVYEYLLTELERLPAPTGAPQQGAPAPASTLLPGDALALAEIAPAPLSEKQLGLLGALVARSVPENVSIEPVVKRLEEGIGQLGGKDSAKRELAAEVLLAARRPIEAARFLPPLESNREAASLPLLDKHVRCVFAEARQNDLKPKYQRAWDLNEKILSAESCPAEVRERAWRRCGDIARFLPSGIPVQWVKDNASRQPQIVANLIVSVAQQVAADRFVRGLDLRQKNLEMQHQLAVSILDPGKPDSAFIPALTLFARNWLEEAEYATRLYVSPRNNQMMTQFDPFGNPIYYGNQNIQQASNNNQPPAIAITEVLESSPSPAWLAALDETVRVRALIALIELNLKLEAEEKAADFIEQLAVLHPKEATRLANQTLRTWATSHDPQRNMPQRRGPVYYINGMYMGNQGIPLTRALQQRNLEELAALVKRLRAMPIQSLEDSAIVSAFTAAHSQAEVFRAESIELVLGKVEEQKPETLAELLQVMRQRLATQWRKPSVQQQAKTNRNDAQIDAEVLRGYELLGSLIDAAVKRQPDNWRLNLTQAATWYDWAEFQYGKKVDLAIYVEKREGSFNAFQRAADLYAATLPGLGEKDETPLVYQQWLNANLGASDLAMVTRQQEPSAGHIERVRKAIMALPGEAAERHLNSLAKAVASSTDSLPPNMKPGYMRAALKIVGDRSAAEDIKKLVTYYDGLLREIELSLRIDGETTVGHGISFGAFLTIRHTAEIERENAGGFGKYLRNNSQNPYFNPYGIAPVDHRDELEKQMREKLNERFEVVSVTFHDEKVQSRGYGRDGWRETPLAYLLLKARDASADRLPPIRVDIDFLDRYGPVVLPVESPVQLLDARPASLPSRPTSAIEVASVLDDRTLNEKKISLEVKATGRGIIPDFRELFEFTPVGFKIEELNDSGPAIQRFDSEGDELAGVCERNWMIKLRAESSGAIPSNEFQFPKPKDPTIKTTFKRYQDADLIDVPANLALAGFPLRSSGLWRWGLLGIPMIGIGLFAFAMSRRKAAINTVDEAYALPSPLNPFTALQFLRRIHADTKVNLSSEQRAELAKAIATIETHFFSPGKNGNPEPDLSSIGTEWVNRVRTVGKS